MCEFLFHAGPSGAWIKSKAETRIDKAFEKQNMFSSEKNKWFFIARDRTFN
jgi:hypothetical protein